MSRWVEIVLFNYMYLSLKDSYFISGMYANGRNLSSNLENL